MVGIKSDQWTLMDTCTHPEHPMKIKRQALCDVSSSRATWQNLSTPSSIKRTRLKHYDLYLTVLSESLIQDETLNTTATPNLLIYTHVIQQCKPFFGISSN